MNTAGAKVRTVPIAPSTPTVGTPATDTEVQILWTALTYGVDTGLVSITSYSLYSDNAAGDGTFYEIATGLYTSYTVTGLTGGATYLFKVRASNSYGSGDFSSTLSYVPQDVPGEVGIPDVAITSPTSSSTTVTIDWDEPEEHSSTITEYDVRFLSSTGTYVRSTSECAGTDSTTLTTTSCTVSMSEIISLTGLSRDTTIRVKVRAINAIGSGAWSELNTEGATIETVPTGSTTVSFDLTQTTNTETVVEWTEITGSNRGGSSVSIDQYEIQWNQGSSTNGTWELLDYTNDLTYTVDSLSGGYVYRFRVRGYNKYGAGAWSSDAGTGVLTAQAPEAPAAPTVEYVTSQVRIRWSYPTSDNHGAVTAYKILIRASDDTTFVENTTVCDGSRSTVISSMACVFPMTYLREGSYDLSQGDDIIVKVQAYNSRGWSDLSTASATGVTVRQQPG